MYIQNGDNAGEGKLASPDLKKMVSIAFNSARKLLPQIIDKHKRILGASLNGTSVDRVNTLSLFVWIETGMPCSVAFPLCYCNLFWSEQKPKHHIDGSFYQKVLRI